LFWLGPERQAITTTASKDLLVANTPISIKANSNVIINASPPHLFISLPSGNVASKDSTNWYLEQSIEHLQKLYQFLKSKISIEIPHSILGFEKESSKQTRKMIQNCIQNFSDEDASNFEHLYHQLCHDVAKKSAEIFNTNLSKSIQSKRRTAVLENIIKSFFRLNNVEYITCGLDRNEIFAVLIPDLTQWKKEWQVVNISAQPDLTRKQSVVNLIFEYKRKAESLSRYFKIPY